MKILFAGSPGSSAEILQDLFNQECEIVGVISQPDKRSKRSGGKDPSAVSVMANNLGLPLFKPSKIDSEFKEIISTIQCEFLVVSAYGKILPEWLLEHPDISSINVHFSLLPKYRGASPIQSSLLNGDLDSGISIMKMTKGLDEGPIYSAEKITIPENADKHFLETELTKVANKVLFTTLLEENLMRLRVGQVYFLKRIMSLLRYMELGYYLKYCIAMNQKNSISVLMDLQLKHHLQR